MARRLARPVRPFVGAGTAGAWAVLLVAVASDGCRARLRLRTRGGRVFEALYRDRRCGEERGSDRLAAFAVRFVRRVERSETGTAEEPLPVFSELIDPWSSSARREPAPRRSDREASRDWLIAPMGELLDPFATHRRRVGSAAAALHEVADPWRGREGAGGARRLTDPRRRLRGRGSRSNRRRPGR